MNTFVSGESDAKGLSVILPYIAVGPAAVAIRRPELLKRSELGWARPGMAGRGKAGLGMVRQGKEYGRARRGAARRGSARHGKELGLA